MRKKFTVMTLIIAIAVGAFTGYYVNNMLPANKQISQQSDLIGTKRATFSLSDFDDQAIPISDFDGKVVLINFWASWCPPCRREIPAFIEVREFFYDQGFEIIGIAIDEKEKAENFLNSMPNNNYPQLVGYNDAVAVAKLYGNPLGNLPYSVLFDRQGIIRFTKAGEIKKEELIDLIEPLL